MPLAQRRYAEAGLSPKEESALTQETVGGIGTVYDTARQRAESRVARTRNPAGYYEAMGEVGREEGREKEGAQRRNILTRRQAKRSDEDTALQLMANLYGIDTNLLGSVAGLPLGALNARAQGISRSSFGIGPFSFST